MTREPFKDLDEAIKFYGFHIEAFKGWGDALAERDKQILDWLEELKRLKTDIITKDNRPTKCMDCKHCCYIKECGDGTTLVQCTLGVSEPCPMKVGPT